MSILTVEKPGLSAGRIDGTGDSPFSCGMELPRKIAVRMEEMRLSQADLARATGIAQNSISRVLSGKQRLYLDQAKRIADFLSLPLDYIADDELDQPRAGVGLTDQESFLLRVVRELGYEESKARLLGPPRIETPGPQPSGDSPRWIAGPLGPTPQGRSQ